MNNLEKDVNLYFQRSFPVDRFNFNHIITAIKTTSEVY